LRFLPGVLFLLASVLVNGWLWQSAAAQDDVRLLEPLEWQGRAGGEQPASSNSITLTVWISDVITTQTGIEFKSDALRFDREGRPSFAYLAPSGNPPTATIHFARHDGKAWQIEKAGSGAESPPSLAFDASNRPHINYEQLGVIYHLLRGGNGWSSEAVDTGKGAAAHYTYRRRHVHHDAYHEPGGRIGRLHCLRYLWAALRNPLPTFVPMGDRPEQC
jgi:hypothetical protein